MPRHLPVCTAYPEEMNQGVVVIVPHISGGAHTVVLEILGSLFCSANTWA